MSGIKRYVEQDTVLIQQPVLHAICIIDPFFTLQSMHDYIFVKLHNASNI